MREINFKGKYFVKADIVLKTGLHIGGEENMEIGGIDKTVIKDALGRPYIPGSSLKGKLRSLMEYYHEKIDDTLVFTVKNSIRIHMCDDVDCPVCNLFGKTHGKHEQVSGKEVVFENLMPTRLIVRDAVIDESKITKEMMENLSINYTEVKPENTLDRITSAATPRFNERVPAGTVFKSEFVINVYNDDELKYLRELITALKLLEDDYLGGSGSRGYGKVKFENIKIVFKDKEYYKGNGSEKVYEIKELDNINWEDLKNKLKIGD